MKKERIPFRLQVCELYAESAHGVCAAGCKELAEKPEGIFDKYSG